MNIYKPVFFYILFAIIVPSAGLFAQTTIADTADTDIDTAAKSELDIKYDSVLSKAALSLTSLNYIDAIALYKEASVLKPANVFPYKMIIYSEDLAQKQKHADDLKRKAKIRDDLNKANNAIAVKSWDSAKLLFGEVLTLNPEKSDQEYAKSKIEAIDLELARIASRIPPKPAPVVVVVPKNRHEARAMRKMAERNAKLPPALISPALAQKQIPAQAANPIDAPVTNIVAQQKSNATSLPKTIQTKTDIAVNQGNAATATIPAVQKPAGTLSTQKPAVAAPATNLTLQKPKENSAPQKTITAASATNQALQKPAETPLPQPTATAASDINQPVQRPVDTAVSQQSAFAASSADQIVQKPTEISVPQRTAAAAAPATNQPVQKPADTAVHQRSMAAAPAKQTVQKPIEISLPQKTAVAPSVTNQAGKKMTEVVTPQRTAAAAPAAAHSLANSRATQASAGTTAPVSGALSSEPAGSASINLADSTDFIKFICQDISFIGTNAYIKVLIQNYSPTASFHTDTLQVSLKKNNGTLTKLGQRFISSFPVIAPLGESIFVSFADASAGVAPDDIFILEMRDKTRKTQLALQIPWSLYQQQKNL